MRPIQRVSTLASLVLFCTMVLVAASTGASEERIQGGPCRTAVDTAQLAITFARHGLSDNDSAGLVNLGLPYKPALVSLVADSATCQVVIDSFNAHPDNTGSPIASGYVVRAGSAFVLYIPSKGVSYFDQAYRYLFSQAFLH